MLPKITVSCDGRGVVSHVGARLLADVASGSGLTGAFSEALAGTRQRGGGHDPGRVLADLAVMLADGGEAISDLAVLREQHALFGRVASTATAWRVLNSVEDDALSELRAARAGARERAWFARADSNDSPAGEVLAHRAGGRSWPGLRILLDATLVIAHSEKEQAATTFKGSFGFHPLTAWLDNTGEALAAVPRPGNAGANNAADHITVTDRALAQIPDAHRHGTPILISADGAGATNAWLTHLRAQSATGVDVEFTVGLRMGEPCRRRSSPYRRRRGPRRSRLTAGCATAPKSPS